MGRTTVVLVDDEELMRSGLALLIDGADGIEVVGQAANGREGVALINRLRPDVVLMDIRMPVMDGIAAVQALASAQALDQRTPVIMLTAFDTDEFIVRSLRAGAVGFLLKSTPPEALVAAIKAAAAGQQLLSPGVVDKLMAQVSNSPQRPVGTGGTHPGLARLSERERETAELIAQGLTNTEIAARLFISPTTVKTHVRHIMEKLEAPSRIHIVIAVLEARRG
ncbi:response regulator [Corynebacterium endometrii]|uniref:Transcriptional regulatory protein LiaR n=1 Tax=Corynebacterium endometrii TaxID=2488819 RepID=A0A4V1CER1_9CORY|nr:response regulator transcription factor [Corynebacterium endometrii]QCB28988.1 Transcriptional regulatory protein LiaR [Corynebacterium endometrii]